jgi:hypothetical protein
MGIERVEAVSPFQQGRDYEQLFWKHLHSVDALLLHPLAVLLETSSNVFRGGAVSGLLGRIVAVLQLLAARHRRPGGARRTGSLPGGGNAPPRGTRPAATSARTAA